MSSHDTDPTLRCPHCDEVTHNLFDFLFACKKCGKQRPKIKEEKEDGPGLTKEEKGLEKKVEKNDREAEFEARIH